ncbi:MAG TPA: extracellular solute-binding protein [Gemmatimonadaceae bacterium]|jgi:molybdate/tungstate transport system substrate-binding protein
MLPFAADTILIFIAASLTKPLQPTLDAYAARTHTVILRESGASLEHIRKITELHRTPDLLLLADADVFPQFIVPKYSSWFAEFARNRMVVAYTDRSKHAKDINAGNWTKILNGNDVEIGRTDPNLAPVGYRTLLMFDLAERHYKTAGLAKTLLSHAPEKNIRRNAAELAALLAAGELDYIYDYQSVAEVNGFKFIQLPPQIDLGDAKQSANYATASVQVRGATPGSTATFKGQPILYGATIPASAPHAAAAQAFYRYLTSAPVVAQLRAAHIDMLEPPIVVGRGAP